MSVIENGQLAQLSVSQAERFDHTRPGGCQRAWFFEVVRGLKPEQSEAAKAGDAGHALFAMHFGGNPIPARAKMRKAVVGAIEKGALPKPGADLLVELRGDGQPKYHATETNEDGTPKWLPLNREKTLRLGGVPWDLFIDLTFRRTDVPVILDHKFKSKESFAESLAAFRSSSPDERKAKLIGTIQLPVYVAAMRRRWSDAARWWIGHNVVSRDGVSSFVNHAIVTSAEIDERIADIETRVVPAMKLIATATSQDDVPFNRKSCEAWFGCPHQSVCNAFRENQMDPLNESEAALFDEVTSQQAAGAEADPFAAPPPASASADSEDDEIAKMEAEIAAKKKKKADEAAAAAKKAADDAAKKAADEAAAAKKKKLAVTDVITCDHCEERLTPENASQLTSGKWKHVGCKKAPVAVLPDDAPKSNPAQASEAPKAGKGKTPAPTSAAPLQIVLNVNLDEKTFAALRTLFGK